MARYIIRFAAFGIVDRPVLGVCLRVELNTEDLVQAQRLGKYMAIDYLEEECAGAYIRLSKIFVEKDEKSPG